MSNSLPGRRLDELVFAHYGALDMLQAVCDANPGVAGLRFLTDSDAAALTWPARPNPTAKETALWNGWGEGLENA